MTITAMASGEMRAAVVFDDEEEDVIEAASSEEKGEVRFRTGIVVVRL